MSSAAILLAQTQNEQVSLTVTGALIMIVSVGLVLGLIVFCFWRILHEPSPSEHHHVPLDIDTRDLDD